MKECVCFVLVSFHVRIAGIFFKDFFKLNSLGEFCIRDDMNGARTSVCKFINSFKNNNHQSCHLFFHPCQDDLNYSSSIDTQKLILLVAWYKYGLETCRRGLHPAVDGLK